MRLMALSAGTLCAVLTSVVGAQEGIPIAKDAGSGGVAETSTWATGIERQKNRLRSISRDLRGQPSGDGVLRLFLDGKSLRKVEVTFPGRARRVTRHYYLEEERPRLIIVRESIYERIGSQKVAERLSEFLWFAGDSLVYWLDPQGRGTTGETPEAAARGADALQTYRTMMEHRAAQYR